MVVLIKLCLIDEEIKLERVHLPSALKRSGCTTDFYRSGPVTCNVGYPFGLGVNTQEKHDAVSACSVCGGAVV